MNFTSKIKNQIKAFLELLHYHKKDNNFDDVMVFSTPRSGTTLLFDIITLNPGIKAISEPLYPKRRELNDIMRSKHRWCDLTKKEEENFKKHFAYLLSERMSTYSFFKPQHKWKTNRTFIKCLRAPGLLEWFLKNYNFHIIFLMRHPIPSSLSRIRNGWGVAKKAKADEAYSSFYESEYYQKYVLNDEVKTLIQEKVVNGSDLERQVIYWCLEHIKVLNNLKKISENTSFTLLTYEELTLKNEKVIKFLSKKLDLTNVGKMMQLVNKPSNSSKHSIKQTNEAIKEVNKTYLIEKWKEKVSVEDQNEISKILDCFNIDIYNGSSVMPKDSYTIFS